MAYSKRQSSTSSFCACWRATPWGTLLVVVALIIGLILWAVGSSAEKNAASDLMAALTVSPALSSRLLNSVTAAIVGVAVGGIGLAVLALLLVLCRTAQRGGMRGDRCCCFGSPSPSTLRAYRVAGAVLGLLVYILQIVMVILLMLQALTLGGAVATREAIRNGRREGDAALRPLGLTSDQASDAGSFISTLGAAAQQALGSLGAPAAVTAVQPVCPPACLNLGSFAPAIGAANSCVCGGGTLRALESAAGQAVSSGGVALAGAVIAYIASTLLFMLVAGKHQAQAHADEAEAREMRAASASRAEQGYAARPEDVVVAGGGPSAPPANGTGRYY